MTATATEREYFFHIISAQEPDSFAQRHIDIEVGQEHAYARTQLFPGFIHNFSLSMKCGRE